MEGGDTSRCMFLRLYVLSWRSHIHKKIPHINIYTLKASKRHLHLDDFKCAVFKDFECCASDVKFENGTIFSYTNYNNLFHIILLNLNEPDVLPDSHHYTPFCIYVYRWVPDKSPVRVRWDGDKRQITSQIS